MEKFIRLSSYDNLSCLSVHSINKSFPEHYHDTYCFTLIGQGIECIKLGQQMIYGEAGQLTITHPYEVHANPILDKTQTQAFDTFYLSPELVRFFLGGKLLHFPSRKIQSPSVNQQFRLLKSVVEQKAEVDIEFAIRHFLASLFPYSSKQEHIHQPSCDWEELQLFISNHLNQKLTLDKLAHVAGMDKYNFAKKFKSQTGMSPINYVLMQKVFAAKAEIDQTSELTSIAYLYDFTDMAHFSRTFKRFVGIAPQIYQNGLISWFTKIVQAYFHELH